MKIIGKNLEIYFRTTYRNEKTRRGKTSQENSNKDRVRNAESQKKKHAGARKGKKIADICEFQCFVALVG